MEYSARYTAAIDRWAELTPTLAPDQPVPCVAPWTLTELLAHVVGLAADVASDNLAGWPLDEWTAAQVDQRAGRSLDELLDEWRQLAPLVCARFDDPVGSGLDPLFARMTIVDVTAHEADLHEAIGRAEPIDPLDWEIVGLHRREMLDGLIAGAGLPALQVLTPEGDDWVVGGSDPAGQISAPRRDLWRSLTGRRPKSFVRAFDWTVDPEPYLQNAWTSPTLPWPDEPTPT